MKLISPQSHSVNQNACHARSGITAILFRWLSSLVILASPVMSGCWQIAVIKQPPSDDSDNISTKVGSELLKLQAEQVIKKVDTDNTQHSNQMDMSLKTMAFNASVLGEPVTYPPQLWDNAPVSSLDISTVGENPQVLSKIISTDDNSLDYASHPAVKHRFMNNNAPYFDLVDSEQYLEIGWHYANPSDSDAVKDASINHAKKAHKFARQLMGEAGGQLISDILKGKKYNNIITNGTVVSLAKCEFYGCVVVMKKPAKPILVKQENQDDTNSAKTD